MSKVTDEVKYSLSLLAQKEVVFILLGLVIFLLFVAVFA